MVRYLFYTIGDLTYQSPLVLRSEPLHRNRFQMTLSYGVFIAGTLLLIGAPRRWLVVLAVLLVAIGVGVGIPLALRAGNGADTSLQEHLEMATRLPREVPLVDG